jgi:dTDP-4-amino-4,6-dideoxygalactose transaminase
MNFIPIAKPIIGKEEKKAVNRVLASGMLAQGKEVEEFEKRFAKYIGTKHAIATTNGTSALMLALVGLNIKGEVLVPSFTHVSTATSILYAGAKPVFVDIDPDTYCMDPADAKKKITDKTEAILPVHLYGQPCQMDELRDLAQRDELYIVEDACQAHGAEFKGKRVGSLGDAGCFSFYPTKNMTTGEGGMVTTDNDMLALRMRAYRDHGQEQKYCHTTLGYNFRMTNIHAAIGIEQLKKLDRFNKARQANAKYYNKAIEDVEKTPFEALHCKHVYHQYTLWVDEREKFLQHLTANSIGYGVHYPRGAHQQPVINSSARLKWTEEACDHVASIPVHPSLSKKDLERVAEAVNSF